MNATSICCICWGEYEVPPEREKEVLERVLTGGGTNWCSKRCRALVRRKLAAGKAYKAATTDAERRDAFERGRAAKREADALQAATLAAMPPPDPTTLAKVRAEVRAECDALIRARDRGADVPGVVVGPVKHVVGTNPRRW